MLAPSESQTEPPSDDPDLRPDGARVSGFDRQTLRALFDEHHDSLFRYLYRLSGNASDAEDLLQDTFLTVWRKRHQFEGRGAAAGYLRRTAHRVFLNARQRRDRRAGLFRLVERDEDAAGAADERVGDDEAMRLFSSRVREAIAELGEPMREAFVLFRFEGMTCAEIAAATDVPVKTIESRVRRATLSLADRLRPLRREL